MDTNGARETGRVNEKREREGNRKFSLAKTPTEKEDVNDEGHCSKSVWDVEDSSTSIENSQSILHFSRFPKQLQTPRSIGCEGRKKKEEAEVGAEENSEKMAERKNKMGRETVVGDGGKEKKKVEKRGQKREEKKDGGKSQRRWRKKKKRKEERGKEKRKQSEKVKKELEVNREKKKKIEIRERNKEKTLNIQEYFDLRDVLSVTVILFGSGLGNEVQILQ